MSSDHSSLSPINTLQEAELLCDRIGIFVDGQLVCLDTPHEITARFAGAMLIWYGTTREFEGSV